MSDFLDLVRRYEPVLLFSKDGDGREENFFPMSVADYLPDCTMYRQKQGPIKPAGTITLDYLAGSTPWESQYTYLVYGAHQALEDNPEWANWWEGGYESFTVNAVATDTELADDAAVEFGGPVENLQQLPPEVSAAARRLYTPYRNFRQHPPTYYYRVLANRGFRVIQYWFFYAYNDWGQTHDGLNEHEADWEGMFLFLDGETPRYAAYAAHTGSPFLFRWDSDELERRETHPVVYIGCGSHAAYGHSGDHRSALWKDWHYGNSYVSIGHDARYGWGDPTDVGNAAWMSRFAGHYGLQLTRYGQQMVAAGAQAPRGPAWQHDRWERPVHWAKIRDVS